MPFHSPPLVGIGNLQDSRRYMRGCVQICNMETWRMRAKRNNDIEAGLLVECQYDYLL